MTRCLVCEHPADSHPTENTVRLALMYGDKPRCALCGTCYFTSEGVQVMHDLIERSAS